MNSPLSQELLNSVRTAKSELRRITGSEPKKLMDVAEYRSFPVGQEQDDGRNSWGSIIHNNFKQHLIDMPLMNWTWRLFWLSAFLNEQDVSSQTLGYFAALQIYTTVKHVYFKQSHLTETLTNHEGGVSLERIERTLPLTLLLLSLQSQLSINKRLTEMTRERGTTL